MIFYISVYTQQFLSWLLNVHIQLIKLQVLLWLEFPPPFNQVLWCHLNMWSIRNWLKMKWLYKPVQRMRIMLTSKPKITYPTLFLSPHGWQFVDVSTYFCSIQKWSVQMQIEISQIMKSRNKVLHCRQRIEFFLAYIDFKKINGK